MPTMRTLDVAIFFMATLDQLPSRTSAAGLLTFVAKHIAERSA